MAEWFATNKRLMGGTVGGGAQWFTNLMSQKDVLSAFASGSANFGQVGDLLSKTLIAGGTAGEAESNLLEQLGITKQRYAASDEEVEMKKGLLKKEFASSEAWQEYKRSMLSLAQNPATSQAALTQLNSTWNANMSAISSGMGTSLTYGGKSFTTSSAKERADEDVSTRLSLAETTPIISQMMGTLAPLQANKVLAEETANALLKGRMSDIVHGKKELGVYTGTMGTMMTQFGMSPEEAMSFGDTMNTAGKLNKMNPSDYARYVTGIGGNMMRYMGGNRATALEVGNMATKSFLPMLKSGTISQGEIESIMKIQMDVMGKSADDASKTLDMLTEATKKSSVRMDEWTKFMQDNTTTMQL